ncbi:MAG: 50S ribosomal protein L11 methyltransferase [Actinobacteria bacterium]|nr:50S ribosomal protein L11 methyltransferase [Actinomycetota bacterium]
MRQLVVTVAPHEAELASDALWGLGVVAVEERHVADGIELWTSLGDADSVDLPWPWRFVEVEEAVADTWRQFATPIWVEGDLVVRPAWVPFEAPAGVTVLSIEPGATFGMGDHPTTRLTLAAARDSVTPGCSVLDVGCGSAVLAIGSLLFGAGSAVGIDIAPAAVPVAEANALANGVRVDVSTTPLEELAGEFDLVLANILAPALVALAPHLRRVLAPGGTLVVSGILEYAHAHVLRALEPLQVVRTDTLDGWAAVTLR